VNDAYYLDSIVDRLVVNSVTSYWKTSKVRYHILRNVWTWSPHPWRVSEQLTFLLGEVNQSEGCRLVILSHI